MRSLSVIVFLFLSPLTRATIDTTSSPKSPLSRYLQQKKTFHIQGWRWHTLSLVRDAGRLEKLAVNILKSQRNTSDNDNNNNLEEAARHVIDFNMNGLHKIETDLFFPWLREKMVTMEDDDGRAFSQILDEIEEERHHVTKIAVAVKEQARIASSAVVNPQKRSEAILNVAQMSAALTSRMRGIMEKEDTLLVPVIAAVVSEGEQKSFNKKVIFKLGLLDSRLHLVGMHDAVWEVADLKERELFDETIPYLPRMMIPRWKRNLYLPQAGVLDLGA